MWSVSFGLELGGRFYLDRCAMGYPTQVGSEGGECTSSVMDRYLALGPDIPELRVGMDLFRFGLIPGHDRMSGIDSSEDAAMDILGGHDLRRPNVHWM